jgi:tetratricopeptide (TPR) repeat protein
MIKNLLVVFFLLIMSSKILSANTQYFQEGLSLYQNKKFGEAKFKFEQDIVFNPKNEMSYLYLSKIFKNLKKRDLEEENLKTVILINPTNEEAIYNLAKLKLDNSDYKKSEQLNDKLLIICNKFCDQSKKLKKEIDNLLKK